MLIAFVAMIAMVDYLLEFANTSLADIFGVVFKPLAFLMGAPWEEAGTLGTLMGEKIVLTELIAYKDLSEIRQLGQISDRTSIIASYALCGFANFASIGIQMGGIGGIAPGRKKRYLSTGNESNGRRCTGIMDYRLYCRNTYLNSTEVNCMEYSV